MTADENPWELDPTVMNLMTSLHAADEIEVAAREMSERFRHAIDARITELIPNPVKMLDEAEDAGIVQRIADGLIHLAKVPQPDGASLSHHGAFSSWVTDWVIVSVAVHNWCVEKGPGEYTLRASCHIREIRGPFHPGTGSRPLFTFPEGSMTRVGDWYREAAAKAGCQVEEPFNIWGGGLFINCTIIGPVHPTVIKAAAKGGGNSVSSNSIELAIPPAGWV